MKARIYQTKNKITYSFDVYSVDENGREEFQNAFVYDETKDPKFWAKELAYKSATDLAKSIEFPDHFKKLVYETGSDDNEGCVKYETE